MNGLLKPTDNVGQQTNDNVWLWIRQMTLNIRWLIVSIVNLILISNRLSILAKPEV
ncbi:hypothetical protein [Acinetobacter guillouiae]|jgi:hypothetical protein|uniref:hypothetical protein n=1 Tax=Acinetobacter guillouiae TaxID=106649 RepID=UPI00148B8AC3